MLGRIQPQKSFGDQALDLHVSDSHFLVIDRADAQAVYADAACCDADRRKRLRQAGIRPRIRFNPRGGELTPRQTALNHRWSKVRAKVERIFADWKERRSLARCRYEGLKKNALHFTLLMIAHSMRRWLGMTG